MSGSYSFTLEQILPLDECNAIAQQIQQKFMFSNCVGLIDGTLNPFPYKPQMEDAADYSRCKYGYSLSTLVA